MPLQLTNTLSGRKEPFVAAGVPVKMYVCGVTPYDTTHLGHARTYVFFDVVHRYLRALGHEVRYVQNITDVDEPLFEKARHTGASYRSLAAENVATYLADMAALHVIPAALYPRASEEIADMIAVIEGLLARGHAYAAGGSVFFRVHSDPGFGELSKLSRAEMVRRGLAQGNDPADRRKEAPLDFVLWQPSAPDEPSWRSPWGPGRPGWHIECTTMAMKYLGQTIDIHGGGDDLIFPHHEAEIAQAEAYSRVHPFAHYWLHTGMVRLAGIKMSKSLGNLIMVRDLLGRFSSDTIRLYLLSYPYRAHFDYDEQRMGVAEMVASELREAVARRSAPGQAALDVSLLRERVYAALDDDLDTPRAIAELADLARNIQRVGEEGGDVRHAQGVLSALSDLLGLTLVRARER